MNEFTLKTKIVFGDNAISELQNLSESKFFIIADPYIVSGGMINTITGQLKEKDFRVFSEIVPDPPLETVAQGIKEISEYKPQCVIAVGGGSAIDTAKAILFYGDSKNIRFIAVPTTSGTGSEVTSFSVITDKSKGIKYPLVSDEMIPDTAILEVDFVKTVPQKIVADTGIDVLTHAIEAYVSVKATDFSDAFAEKAIRIVRENLLKSYSGDKAAKEKMHTASLMAGLAFNSASLGLNHAIAHNIGARLHIPHGRANGILLPQVIKFNSGIADYTSTDYNECAVRYAQIAKLFGIDGGNIKILVKGLVRETEKLMKAMGMPLSLKEAGTECSKETAELIADGAISDNCIKTNPQKASKADILKIIDSIRG